MIDFNRPYLTGRELFYIEDSVRSGQISGNGKYTKKCHEFFKEKYGFQKVLLTTSCTDALEMAAILLNIEPGDEVIIPSYTFVSTANAFVLRGAKIVFIDSRTDHPGMNEDSIESLITSKTKAIVPVHYAGVSCDMIKIMDIARRYNLMVIEDAAQAIDSFCSDEDGNAKPLGSWGHLAAFSFHETKNVISGEGGLLVVNDPSLYERAEIIWEKGTNRSQFFRGEVDKYGWVDIGSSFLPSDLIAAFLFAQLENIQEIQNKRKRIWEAYYKGLTELKKNEGIGLPSIPEYSSNNAHIFWITCKNFNERKKLIAFLNEQGIRSVFHYQSLHKSNFQTKFNESQELPLSDFYTDTLLRLPIYFELSIEEVNKVIEAVNNFYRDVNIK